MKVIAGVSSVTLLVGGVAGYKLFHKGPPSFRRGGEFAAAGGPVTTSTTAAAAEATSSTTAAPATTPSSVAPTGPASTASTATTARRPGSLAPTTATSGPAAVVTPTTRASSGPAPSPTPGPTGPPGPGVPPAAPGGTGRPALGTYTYAIDGTEGASFVGTRKFPEKMTTVVHTGPGLAADQLVFDLTYSDKHAEREIVGFRADGVFFDFEGGSVTFGPRTETSQADYEPPILQVPATLRAGFTRSGVTKAKGADGGVSRTEDWTTTVVGQETVTIAGASVATWKIQVDRKFRPGGADQGQRSRTLWFDPARNIWVKFVEVFHGERKVGISFTYDSNVTAVLSGFTAG